MRKWWLRISTSMSTMKPSRLQNTRLDKSCISMLFSNYWKSKIKTWKKSGEPIEKQKQKLLLTSQKPCYQEVKWNIWSVERTKAAVQKTTSNKARKGNNKYTHWEERHKTLFTDDIILYVENLKELIKKKKKLLKLTSITNLQNTRLTHKISK